MNTLILGVGTGRCGTKSLVRLLDHQPRTAATHERYEDAVRWNCPAHLWPLRLWRDTERPPSQTEGPSYVADVAFNWTPHIETFLRWADREGRDVRIIGLKRDRREVVDSYKRWKRTADHWRFHGESPEGPDPWDRCYPPELSAGSKGEAIGMFWDRVYKILEGVQREDGRVQVFRTEDLNTEEGVRRILDFCGYEDPAVKPGIRIKAPTIEDARNSTQW